MATGAMGLSAAPVTAAAATTRIPLIAESAQAVQRLVSPRRASRVVFRKASQAYTMPKVRTIAAARG
jgi:hypothetical protein